MPMTFTIERVYDCQLLPEHHYVLIDRLWPRGVRKEKLQGVQWAKELAPSVSLRKWFHEDTDGHWEGFARQYRDELTQEKLIPFISAWKQEGYASVVLLYGSKQPLHNHARILRDRLTEVAGEL